MGNIVEIGGQGVEEVLSDIERSQRCARHFSELVKKFQCAYTPILQVDPGTGYIKFTGLNFIPMKIIKLDDKKMKVLDLHRCEVPNCPS